MKRILGILITLLLVLPVLAGEARADGMSGKAGDNITFYCDYETDTLTFSGTGEMYDEKYIDGGDCDYLRQPWWGTGFRHVIIGEGITNIGELCFAETYIESIQLPSTLKTIDSEAFFDTPKLEHIDIPDGVTAIRSGAFQESGLKSVRIPASLETMGEYVFLDCDQLTQIILPESMTRIPDYLLSGIGSIETFVIPEGIAVIGKHAFDSCKNLKSITFPETLKEVGEYAFEDCESLTKVVIPESVTTIGKGAFMDCAGLTDITFPSGLKALPTGVVTGCTSLANIEIPAGVTEIGSSAFSHCPITQIHLPEGLKNINDYLFFECKQLETVEIPEGVTSIGTSAFEGCTSLTQITVPGEVKSLGASAFLNCSNLRQIELPETMTKIGKQVFRGCSKVRSITVPNGITVIPWSAFSECVYLEELILPEGLKTIEDWAFSYCMSLMRLELPEGLEEIGDKVFNECDSLTYIKVPSTLKSLGDEMFIGCSALEEFAVYEDNSVYAVQDGVLYSKDMATLVAFPGAKVLTEDHFAIPEGVKEIVDGAFAGRDDYFTVSFPGTMTKISEGAFYDCDGLTEVHLPDQITEIGWNAFMFCDNLKTVTLSPATSFIDGFAFCSCKSLTEIVIPPGVTDILTYTFNGCESMEWISIPVTVKTIDSGAFSDCDALEDVYYSGSSTQKKEISGYKRLKGTWHYNCLAKPSVKLTMTDSGNPRLKWSAVSKADKYYIFRSKTKSGGYRVLGSTTSMVYTDTRAGNQKYYYKVAAWDNSKSVYSGFSKVVESTVVIKAPTVTISGSASSGKPILKWNKIDNAEKYRIYRATSKSGSYELIETVTATTFTDKSAKAGKNCYYKIKAVLGSDTSPYSKVVNRVCDLKKPVVTLKVDTASGKPKVTFEKISGAEKYYIVRSTSKTGTYSKVAAITGTTYIDKTAKAGKSYYYKVKALHAKDAADSAYSEITNRVCDLAKPVVTIKCNTSGNPWLKWEAISGAQKYEVYRATSSTGTYKLVKTTKTATSFADKDVTAGKTYYYKVRAIHENTAANSAYSAVKFIKAQ